MKKLLSLMLAICISGMLYPAAFAAEKESSSVEAVLKSVKERIADTSEFDEFSSNSYKNDDNHTVYSFYWTKDEGDDYKNLSVTVTDNGIITDYYTYIPSDSETKVVFECMELDKALSCAKTLIKKLNPAIADNIRVISNNREDFISDTFSFTLEYIQNGVPVAENQGYMEIDSTGERIINYWLNIPSVKSYPPVQKAISVEQARESYKTNIGIELVYKNSYDWQKDETRVYAAYQANEYESCIDAVTGKVYERNNHYGYPAAVKEMAMEEDARAANGLSDAEIAELENIKGLISVNEAESKVLNSKILELNRAYKLDSYNITSRGKDDKKKYYYNMSFVSNKKSQYANAVLDAKTGDIISYRSDYDYSDKMLNEKKLSDKANTAFAELFGERSSEYVLMGTSENEAVFRRTVNGIKVENDVAYVRFDGATGRLVGYSTSYTDGEFPSIENVMSLEQAYEKLFSYADYTLKYIINYDKNDKPFAELVYSLNDSVVFDPVSGARLDYNGKEEKPQSIDEYTDIDGHYAEDIINALRKYNIGFSESTFRPDEAITQKDFLTILISAFNRCSSIAYDEEEIYNQAVSYKVIKREDINPSAVVSRIDAAIYICRIMGLEKYALLDGIYKSPFSDVTDSVGYVALLYGVKIISGNGGSFEPDASITRAQAAVMIYKYLSVE